MPTSTADKPDTKFRVKVACDVFRYGGVELKDGRWVYQTAYQGDVIDVTDAERERANKLAREHGRPFLVGEHDDIPGVPGSPTAAWQATDEQLDAMDFEGLVAYLGQNNAEVGRVAAREAMRPEPRPAVMGMIERLRSPTANLTA